MSDIFGKIKSGAGNAAHAAAEAAKIKQIEMNIGGIKKQIEEQHHKLGELTYNSKVKNEPESPEAQDIITKITDLHAQIKAKEEEIKNIKEDKEPPKEASPGKKFCTNCGKENDASVKFCAECGTKLG